MIKNLKDLSEALETGTKGEVFDFTVCGKNTNFLLVVH